MEAAAAAAPAWDAVKVALCFCCARAEYFDELEADLKSSQREVSRLKEIKEHVETRIRRERRPQTQQLYKVTDWFKRVNDCQKDADEIIKEGEEEINHKVFRWLCPKHCCGYNRVGKKVTRILTEVTQLIKDGEFDAVVERRRGDLVNEMPVPETVGLELKFDEIWRLVEDPKVGIIGLYGMGGVGKTTLLKMIYNKIWSTRDYVLIWVDKSEQDPIKAVQEAVRKKFEISEEFWKSKNEEDRVAIWKYLKSEKFVLLLDDVGGQWHYHLLEEVGVPLDGNRNGSKVIFTTRSKEVCDKMRAKSIEINCLPIETALELFQLCVGQPVLSAHPEIPQLAKDAAQACNGLPLLLVAFGRAMASKTNFRGWKLEVEKLKEQATKIHDVKAEVFAVLKVSYDTLSSDTHKKCFLSFCLFPEGHHIKKQEIIELWIAEGLLDWCKDVFDSREEGEEIISNLKLASLLESGKSDEFVKMHAVIREMALWLACADGEAEDRILVDKNALEFPKWKNAKWISVWNANLESLPDTPSCHYLTALLLRARNLKTLPSGFFDYMHALTVLDLSQNNGLADLPAGIGKLGSLYYLNLSGTSITKLPLEVQSLKNLKILITGRLVNIEQGMISSMASLILFRMLDHPKLHSPEYVEASLLEEFECLENINELGLILLSPIAVQRLLDSLKLRKCIKQLTLVKLTDQASVPLSKLSLRRMEHLERLEILDCLSLMEVEVENSLSNSKCFQNLFFVGISNCQIKNVGWLTHAPNLQRLILNECEEIIEVVTNNFEQNVFSKLTHLSLSDLPKLKYICGQAVQFPSLERLFVFSCPALKELPLNSDSAKNLKEIRGERDWWNNLRWSSEATKYAFFLKFQQTEKQKLVIRVKMSGIKWRPKALKAAASIPGVESVAIDKDTIVVMGKDIDAIKLTASLRNRIGIAELVSVGPAAEPASKVPNLETSSGAKLPNLERVNRKFFKST